MKLTKSFIKQVIKEELQTLSQEGVLYDPEAGSREYYEKERFDELGVVIISRSGREMDVKADNIDKVKIAFPGEVVKDMESEDGNIFRVYFD